MQGLRLLCLVICMFGSAAASAARPAIAIIIDDLGNRASDKQVIQLPGAITCAFLPHTPYTPELARLAHQHNKQVMLHVPMQSMHVHELGPGSLTLDMNETEIARTLQRNLAAVPHVQGVNNHMGSLLTQHPGHMLWLMQAMNKHGDLFFVDSRTTAETVAKMVADENQIPNLSRDVFLDAQDSVAFVESQFKLLIRKARKNGTAVGIAHPYPNTMKVLRQRLAQLEELDIDLISVSDVIKRQQEGKQTWQLSLSHLPRAAKNSKQ